MKTLDIIGHTGVPMFARLVEAGDRYGRNGCLVWQGDDPLVEFYDRRYDFEKWLGRPGQFITRYYLSTLRDPPHTGLCLDGGTEDWAISGDTLEQVVIWARDDLADLSRRVGRIFDDMKADALKRLPACTSAIEDHGRRRQYELEEGTAQEYVTAYWEAINPYNVNLTYAREIRSAGL